MAYVLFGVITVNVVLFAGIAVWSVRTALGEDSARLRLFAWVMAAVAGAFVLGAVTRLLLVGVRLGWIDGRVSDFISSDWHLVQSLAATALGIGALVLARGVALDLRRAQRVIDAIGDRLPTATDLEAFGLTAREREVLAVLAAGKLSDNDVAEALYISPATAGTHIKNILRKTGMRSRRDLVLLAAIEES